MTDPTTLTPDDPRLTAYLLGELTAEETAELQAELADSPEAQAELTALKALMGDLEATFTEPGPPALGDDQRAAIETALKAPRTPHTAPGPDTEPDTDTEPEPEPEPEPEKKVVPLRRRLAPLLLAGVGLAAAGLLTLNFLGNGVDAKIKEQQTKVAALARRRAALEGRLKAHQQREAEVQRQLAGAKDEAESARLGRRLAKAPRPTGGAARDLGLLGGRGSPNDSLGAYARQRSAEVTGAADGKPKADEVDKAADAPAEPSAGDRFAAIDEHPFVSVAQDPLSTFSIDVDTASYSITRSYLTRGRRPPPSAVRVEEFVNYFDYGYAEPTDGRPFAVHPEVAATPWNPKHRLLRVGLKGKDVANATRPRANLVFLLDVSGSMTGPNRLGLVKRALSLLTRQLDGGDRVSIVVYAGASGVVLKPTPGNQTARIERALSQLSAGGSTNGGEGIQLAYRQARAAFIQGGINRVLLATDGDFNVGPSSRSELSSLIKKEAKSGVFLSVLGFGRGNTNDAAMERLADDGNGNYAYIDGIDEARKVLVKQAKGTLITIAKDVKIQLVMNPKRVTSYRLIGYENRKLAHQDFANDKKDAGDIGAGHTVTALYELVPGSGSGSGELVTVKLRYKQPQGSTSQLLEVPVKDGGGTLASASNDFKLAAGVAAFGMVLRGSRHVGSWQYDDVARFLEPVTASQGESGGELLRLVRRAKAAGSGGLGRPSRVRRAPSRNGGSKCNPSDPMCF